MQTAGSHFSAALNNEEFKTPEILFVKSKITFGLVKENSSKLNFLNDI